MSERDYINRMPWFEENFDSFLRSEGFIIGNSHEYPSPFENHFHKGIYFLIKDEAIVYVGLSNNVEFRLTQHEGLKDFDYVYSYDIEPFGWARYIEAYYIGTMKPKLNRSPGYPGRFVRKKLAEIEANQ